MSRTVARHTLPQIRDMVGPDSAPGCHDEAVLGLSPNPKPTSNMTRKQPMMLISVRYTQTEVPSSATATTRRCVQEPTYWL